MLHISTGGSLRHVNLVDRSFETSRHEALGEVIKHRQRKHVKLALRKCVLLLINSIFFSLIEYDLCDVNANFILASGQLLETAGGLSEVLKALGAVFWVKSNELLSF